MEMSEAAPGTGERTHNVYDDPRWFETYSGLRVDPYSINEAVEQPALRALLPPLAGLRVLDVGCGMGFTARYCADSGAARVVGFDLAPAMIAYALAHNAHPRIEYRVGSMDELDFPAASFDLVVSSFCIMMTPDHRRLVARIHDWLAPEGRLVYSLVHPLRQAHREREFWSCGPDDQPLGRLSHYFDQSERHFRLVEGTAAVQYHRSVAVLLGDLVDAGLEPEAVHEPDPTADAMQAQPALKLSVHLPTTLLLRARRPRLAPRDEGPALGAWTTAAPGAWAGVRESLELPALAELLPRLAGQRVLDLGCGKGELALACAQAGAASVLALDPREEYVRDAAQRHAHARIEYRRAAPEALDLPAGAFDVAVSRRFFSVVPDLEPVLAGVARALAPGGTLVFSSEHPVILASKVGYGWARDEQGRVDWIVNDYSFEGPRELRYYRERLEPVRFHRKLATLLDTLLRAGWRLRRVAEPQVPPEFAEADPRLALERLRPLLLLVRAERPA
jgi:SAM-dependent methyltransferase